MCMWPQTRSMEQLRTTIASFCVKRVGGFSGFPSDGSTLTCGFSSCVLQAVCLSCPERCQKLPDKGRGTNCSKSGECSQLICSHTPLSPPVAKSHCRDGTDRDKYPWSWGLREAGGHSSQQLEKVVLEWMWGHSHGVTHSSMESWASS
jgi:hypothetical protein